MIYPKPIEAAIKMGATNPPERSYWHGDRHWRCVALVGLWLADGIEEEIDRDFILTFAMLHDIARRDDGKDIMHGVRAGLLFQRIVECGRLPGWDRHDRERVHAMHYAIRNHCEDWYTADVSDETAPLVIEQAICCDADRLNRWRLGEQPDPQYLATRAARSPEASAYAARLCRRSRGPASWDQILRAAA